jgi:hypothetical protein
MMKIRSCLIMLLPAVLAFSAIGFHSCSKAKDLTAFDVTCNLPKIYLNYPPRGNPRSEVTLYTGKVKIPLDSLLTANHIPSGVIASAYLSRLAMVITNPPEATFNWLTAIRIIGSADSTFQQVTQIGSATGIDPGARTIEMTLDKVDLKPIIRTDTYFLRVLATLSGQVPASTVSMYIDSQVKLHIEPL